MLDINRRALLTQGRLLTAGAALSGAALTPRPSQARPSPHGDFATIDAALAQAARDGTVLGAVAMAATPEGIVYEGMAGRANIETGAPMRDDTVFWLLSMTKAFTATAAMQLMEHGRMRLDQPAGEILPELASPRILQGFDAAGQPILRPARQQITVRHLLTHTSGYTYSIWSEALSRYQQATGMPDISTCKNAAFTAPLEFEPGERWQYGTSMDWVGKLVEQVSDQSLEVYFRENIFAPLGMTDSGFLIGSAQKKRLATFANRRPDGSLAPAPFEIPQRPEFFAGGSGAFSTPRDYLAFLQMMLNGGTYRRARVLRSETVALMMANQIGELNAREMRTAQPAFSNSFDQFPGQPHKWGLSFDINTTPGPNGRSTGSISWAGLLNCYFWLDPVAKVTGGLFTQVLPFYDQRIVSLYGAFERGLYRGLGRA